jgi:hypothetical protein
LTNVDETGTENRSAHRYLPVLNTERYSDNVIREWEVARVFVDSDDAEMLDDARLIAAAPELLAELRKMLALWESAISYEPDYMSMGAGARAAIKKAEGRGE